MTDSETHTDGETYGDEHPARQWPETPLTPRERKLYRKYRLTPTEWKIALLLITERNSNKEMARELGISKRTVEVHANRVLLKLVAANRVHGALIIDRALRPYAPATREVAA